MDIIKFEIQVRSKLKQLSDLSPQIAYTNINKKDQLLITYTDNIPDIETTEKMFKALKIFGSVETNHCLEVNYIAFIITK